jgi:O-antigen/teichoic acid export membrane protein
LGVAAGAMRFVPQAVAKGRLGLAAGFYRRSFTIIVAASSVCMLLAAAVILAVYWDAPESELQTLLLGTLLIPFMSVLMGQNDAGRAVYLMASTFLPNMLLRHLLLLGGVAALYFSGVALNAAWTMGVLVISVAGLAVGQFFVVRRAVVKVVGDAKPEYDTRVWVAAGLPLVVVFGITGFFLEINIALAGAFLGRADLAVYNLAFQIANLISFFLVAVGYQFGPHASRLYAEEQMDSLPTLVSHTSHLRFYFAVAMFIGLALAGPFILGLFSPKFEGGYTALLIIASTQLVAGIAGPVGVLQSIFGLQRQAIVISIIAISVDIFFTSILATQFGMDGAAVAVLITNVVWNVLMVTAVIRNTAVEPSVFGLRNIFGHPHKAAASEPGPNLASPDPLSVELSSNDTSENSSKRTGTADH